MLKDNVYFMIITKTKDKMCTDFQENKRKYIENVSF